MTLYYNINRTIFVDIKTTVLTFRLSFVAHSVEQLHPLKDENVSDSIYSD